MLDMIGRDDSVRVTIDRDDVTFELELFDRVNTIVGYSGIGKTFVAKTISEIKLLDTDVKIFGGGVDSLHSFVYDANLTLYEMLSVKQNAIFVIDEDVHSVRLNKSISYFSLIKLLELNNNIVVFLWRSGIDYPLSPESILTFNSSDGKIISTKQIFSQLTDSPRKSKNLVCEDSGLGLNVLSNLFGVIGNSARGHVGLHDLILSHADMDASNETALIYVFDNCDFWGAYHKLALKFEEEASRIKGKSIVLSLPPSFEYLLLKATDILDGIDEFILDFYKVTTMVDTIKDKYGLIINEFNSYSKEAYYTELLSQLLKQKYDVKYSKGMKLPEGLVIDDIKLIEELKKWRNGYWLKQSPKESDNIASTEKPYDKFMSKMI